MADAWGGSWGGSWGVSWGSAAVVVVEPPVGSVGSSISGGSYSRKRWRKLQELLRAEKAADDKTRALRTVAKKKLAKAVRVARQITVVTPDEGRAIALAVDAAFGARTLLDVIRNADIILEQAREYKPPAPIVVVDPDPEPEPVRRRLLRPRPDGDMPPLEAVIYDIEEELEGHRVTALDRMRKRAWQQRRVQRTQAKAAGVVAERAAERRARINRECQQCINAAIEGLMTVISRVQH